MYERMNTPVNIATNHYPVGKGKHILKCKRTS